MTSESGRRPVDTGRARSFGPAARAYDAHRPGYPDAAVDLALAGLTGSRVLDLGAGTGKLTASLVARGLDVVAVEPDPDMLAVLRERIPGADARQAPAEAIPLADASVDAVVVGQALHWFDLDRATPEIARVLRPGGVLACLWNGRDGDVGWVARVDEIRTGLQAPADNPAGGGEDPDLPDEPWFIGAATERVTWSRPTTTDAFLDDQRTHSWALTSAPADREAVLDRVREFLDSCPQTASGTFDLPMRTIVWRAVRA
ncbi:class I SAM-dependent methyltransferase [Pseudonocardia phyllosphaerae]|uniref:class I SAM-dependent methyltransferase n=1 Tax=Pseudonocardia phyllosphaerae TaxID=3390502 RepID=UPI0039784DBA